jgi:hypothetical protein
MLYSVNEATDIRIEKVSCYCNLFFSYDTYG